VRSSSSSEMRLIGSTAGRLLVIVGGSRCGGRKKVPRGATLLPRVLHRGVGFLGCWKGDDAGTSTMLLAGEELRIGASPGF
jgi:hypothetical protein